MTSTIDRRPFLSVMISTVPRMTDETRVYGYASPMTDGHPEVPALPGRTSSGMTATPGACDVFGVLAGTDDSPAARLGGAVVEVTA